MKNDVVILRRGRGWVEIDVSHWSKKDIALVKKMDLVWQLLCPVQRRELLKEVDKELNNGPLPITLKLM